MSESRHDYHVNFDAATELDEQSRRAKTILETLAANLAANDVRLPSEDRDVVRLQHVRVAAKILFNSPRTATATAVTIRDVFISYSHKDDDFVDELVSKLEAMDIPCFKADRDVRLASDWAESIQGAIRSCRVVLSVLTPRFLTSPWVDIEAGAAKAFGKSLIPAIRYIDRNDVPESMRNLQSIVVETEQQLSELTSIISEIFRPNNK